MHTVSSAFFFPGRGLRAVNEALPPVLSQQTASLGNGESENAHLPHEIREGNQNFLKKKA